MSESKKEIDVDWLDARTAVMTGTNASGFEVTLTLTWDSPDSALDHIANAKMLFADLLARPTPSGYYSFTSRRGPISWTIVRHPFAWPGVKRYARGLAVTLFTVTVRVRRTS